ncbi:MAG: hypothetical protein IPK82_05910 [Polyangiaceae bacterium]|nr:hypothetical protein [Polyangiaceae bacterium]
MFAVNRAIGLVCVGFVCVLGCGQPNETKGLGSASATSAALGASATGEAAPQVTEGCGDRVAKLLKEPALPGSPEFEAHRVELVGRPRGTPLVWIRVPAVSGEAGNVGSAIEKLRTTDKPLTLVKGLVRRFGRSPETLRRIFLREGYVYADDPDLALAMVETLRLAALFREEKVFVLRGAEVFSLTRAEKTRYLPERYVYTNGPYKGEVAEVLLGDRVGLSREELLKDVAAWDVSAVWERHGVDRLRVKHLSAGGLVAEIKTRGGPWITGVFEPQGPGLKLGCVASNKEDAAAHGLALARTEGLRKALLALRNTVRAQVREEPPFDEPKDEPDGEQQDGALRREWRRAYDQGLRRFSIGDVKYDVYDDEGRALPPQVCVDFITDTWERASGTWYKPLPPTSGEERPKPAPGRTVGGIDFDALDLPNRRSVAELVTFAKRHTEMFEVKDFGADERIPFAKRAEFFAFLSENTDDFVVGDVLVIFGVKSDGRPHYHSVMIVESDPITGTPVLVAGNAGRPREQTFEGVMARSPKRSIKHRIRPKQEWLEKALFSGGKKAESGDEKSK